jgi:hypothetical protein
MSLPHDTQPVQSVSSDTQPQRPAGLQQPASGRGGPGCLAWGLLGVAGLAFSLLIVFVAGLFGYFDGQQTVADYAEGTRQAFIDEQLSTWIPQDIANGNVVLLGARIDGLASLTPPPPEFAALVATGTQFALDNQPTATPTMLPSPTVTPTPTITDAPSSPTVAPSPTVDTSAANDPDAPLFDVEALFVEAESQMSIGEYEEAVLTLDAIVGVDPTYRPAEVEAMLFEAWEVIGRRLLRSGDPANLASGIRAANEAANYGDIGELNFEVYVAGLYLDAQSREPLNPLGAIEVYSTLYAQAPNYLDVRTKLFNLRVALGDEYLAAFDFCPAAVQYQAALGIQAGAVDIQEKLETAQTSCQSGQAPGGTPGTPGTPAPIGEAESGATVAPPTSDGPAPLGQRP